MSTTTEYSVTIRLTEDAKGWRATDDSTGDVTRDYDTLAELNAAICDGTAEWRAR